MTPFGRFVQKIEKTDGCWLWTGARSETGYGAFHVGDGRQVAHRVAYEFFVGPIGDGMLVCHRCDNPLCVRPDHLFLGTNAENMRDMVAKGRQRDPWGKNGGRCFRGHDVTKQGNIYRPRSGNRQCRECKLLKQAEYKEARRRARSAA